LLTCIGACDLAVRVNSCFASFCFQLLELDNQDDDDDDEPQPNARNNREVYEAESSDEDEDADDAQPRASNAKKRNKKKKKKQKKQPQGSKAPTTTTSADVDSLVDEPSLTPAQIAKRERELNELDQLIADTLAKPVQQQPAAGLKSISTSTARPLLAVEMRLLRIDPHIHVIEFLA
jgi:hypothetical protein